MNEAVRVSIKVLAFCVLSIIVYTRLNKSGKFDKVKQKCKDTLKARKRELKEK